MDRSETCWHCGRDAMTLTGTFLTCADCGATWAAVRKLGPVTLETHINPAKGWGRGSPGPGARVRDRNTGELKNPPPED